MDLALKLLIVFVSLKLTFAKMERFQPLAMELVVHHARDLRISAPKKMSSNVSRTSNLVLLEFHPSPSQDNAAEVAIILLLSALLAATALSSASPLPLETSVFPKE